MKIIVDISDREMMDIDLAVTHRRSELQKKSLDAVDRETESFKNGNVNAAKAARQEYNLCLEEIKSLDGVIEKLYSAIHNSIGSN